MKLKAKKVKISVGTKNRAKLEAVRKAAKDYALLGEARIISVEVESDVASQPVGLSDTIKGAKNRARKAQSFSQSEYGIGIESGIFKVPHTKSGYMDICICAIFDGQEFHLGSSSCFEYPSCMIKEVIERGLTISEAAKKLGFSHKKNVGAHEGMIGILTKGRLNRSGLTHQAIITAMVHLENKEIYKK